MVHRFLIVIAMSMIGLTSSDFSSQAKSSQEESLLPVSVNVAAPSAIRRSYFALGRAIARSRRRLSDAEKTHQGCELNTILKESGQ